MPGDVGAYEGRLDALKAERAERQEWVRVRLDRPNPAPAGLMGGGFKAAPCACGGEVTVARLTDDEITTAVRGHQATTRHARWTRTVEWG